MAINQPISEDLFTDRPSLIGSECSNCGEIYFPIRQACANCSGTDLRTKDLGHKGIMWSWTIQHFMPKPPYNSDETSETFSPYGIGLVEMDCGIKVKSRLDIDDLSSLEIGQKMTLSIIPFRTDENGRVFETFAFRPEGGK